MVGSFVYEEFEFYKIEASGWEGQLKNTQPLTLAADVFKLGYLVVVRIDFDVLIQNGFCR